MEKTTFEETLRTNLRRDPFQPFVVEKNDGSKIVIGDRSLAFCDGFASYLDPDYQFVQFRCEDVRSIRMVTTEAAS